MIAASPWLTMTLMAAALVGLCIAAFQLAPVIRLRPWNIVFAFAFALWLSSLQADMRGGIYSVTQLYADLLNLLHDNDLGAIAGVLERYFITFPFGAGADAAISVLINLVIVVVYALTRTALMYVIFGAWTGTMALGIAPWGFVGRIQRFFERVADNVTIKAIARTAYILQIVAVISLPTLFWGMDFLGTVWGDELGRFIIDGFSGLLWAISFIICAELYVAIYQPTTLIGSLRVSVVQAGPPARRLLPLFERYQDLPVAPFLARIDNPAPVAPASEDPPDPAPGPVREATSTDALVARLGPLIEANERKALKRTLDIARTSEEPRFLWLAGTLSEPYYHIVVEMMLSVHDKGGVALVICPADIREKVVDNIKHTIGAELFDMMIRWRFTGRGRAGNGAEADAGAGAGSGGRDYHNLLIGAETDLYDDFMSGRRDSIRYEASRLKLIVAVDFHRLDLALLRLEMRRLEVSAGQGAPFSVSVVAQGERRRGVDTQLSQIFPVGTGAFETVTFRPSRARARFWLGWRDDGAFADTLHERFIGARRQGEGPQTLYPALMIPAMTFRTEDGKAPVRLAYYDPDKGFDRHAWADSGEWYSALQSSEDDAVRAAAPVFQALQPLSHIGRADGGDVVFMEDRASLPDVIDRQVDVLMDRDDAMLVTVSAGYPLREYFIARSAEWAQGRTLTVNEADLPLSPDPGTDLGQLANAVLAMIRQPGGAGQADIAAFMGRIAPGPLLETLGINATKIGVQRLLELALGLRETVLRSEDPASHLIRLEASTTGRDDIVSTLFMRVEADGKELCKLQQGDEGLLFTRSSLMQVAGRMYRVIDVRRSVDRAQVNAVIVRKADADWRSAQLRSAPVTLFSRRYAIDSTGFVQERALDRDRYRSALLHLSYDRVTDRLCTIERDRPPFIPAAGDHPARAPSWMSVEGGDGTGQHSERRRYQSAWSLVLPCEGDGEDGARIAMTLCVTLQDTIRSLFPRNWRRVAVISPRCAALAIEKRHSGAPHEQFLARSYPALDPGTLDEADALTGGAGGEGALHLLVIEDAAYGLGCVRALFGMDALPGLWLDSLRWRAREEEGGGEPGYHAFGSGQAQADLLDYEGALHVLERAV